MKKVILMAVVVAAAWAGQVCGSPVAAVPAPPEPALQGPGPVSISQCQRACWQTRMRDSEWCKDVYTVCNWWILGICISTTVKEPCFANCVSSAEDLYEFCLADCLPSA